MNKKSKTLCTLSWIFLFIAMNLQYLGISSIVVALTIQLFTIIGLILGYFGDRSNTCLVMLFIAVVLIIILDTIYFVEIM